jgi:hypothetical protein
MIPNVEDLILVLLGSLNLTCPPKTDPSRMRGLVEKEAKKCQKEEDKHQNKSSPNCVKPRCCKVKG